VSFLSARAYNYPVRQSRHPAVCRWINDAVAAIRDQLEKNTVEKVSLCIYECDENRVLERWTFDLRSFPSVAKRDRDVPFESSSNDDDGDQQDHPLARKVNLADLEANFRATLSRISTSAAKLAPLPEGTGAPECSFTLTIEVKDDADRPVGRLEKEERKWIAAEPELFDNSTNLNTNTSTEEGSSRQLKQKNEESAEPSSKSNSKTHAIRRLEAGELRMEVWVEESAAKFSYPSSSQSPSSTTAAAAVAQQRRAKMSYGAGTDKFNPENAFYQYDLEPPDVNRKPQSGAMTDYQRG
jgi:mitotic spindle assembly checkpoint protein MAD2B